MLKKKSNDYYTLIRKSKAKLPNNFQHLRKTFNLLQDHLKKVSWLPHKVSFEPYIKAFQYKVFKSILLTNTKVTSQSINLRFVTQNRKPYTISFFIVALCNVFGKISNISSSYWPYNSSTLICNGIIYANYPLVNNLILVAKSYIWDCRRNLSPVINAFKLQAKIKYQTEKIICINTNNMD